MIIIMQCRSLSGNGQLRQSCTEKDAMAIKCDTPSPQPTRQVQIKKKSELTKRLYREKGRKLRDQQNWKEKYGQVGTALSYPLKEL